MSSNDNISTPKPRPEITFQSFERPELWTGSFAGFAAEIGYVAWAWNTMQADLCDLFCIIAGDFVVARATWNAIASDSGQRDMLRASALAKLTNDPELAAEVSWLISEVGKLSAIRNDAFHSLWKLDYSKGLQDKVLGLDRASPDPDRGNPRAARLIGFDHTELFRTLAGQLMTLIQFCRHICVHVQEWDDGEPLPQRPPLPEILRAYLHRQTDRQNR